MSVRIVVDLEPEHAQALEAESRRLGVDAAEVVVRAVKAYLAQSGARREQEHGTERRSWAEKTAHLRFRGGPPHNVAEEHDEILYPVRRKAE